MKGVILAGGNGTRLAPLNITNKHLVAVCGPSSPHVMIDYPLNTLLKAGIREIMVVTGGEHLGAFLEYLGSGSKWNCEITYRVQDRPDGISSAINCAHSFVGKEPFVVILGDNYFEDDISPFVKLHKAEGVVGHARCLLKEVPDPERFGVAVMRKGKITRFIEKPKKRISSYAVTGCYMLDAWAFRYFHDSKPSARGEYEITDILNGYRNDDMLKYHILEGFWSDMGVHESREKTEAFLRSKVP